MTTVSPTPAAGSAAETTSQAEAASEGADPQATLHRYGKSFAWASRFLSPVHADRSARLYAACRAVDDLADDVAERARIEALSGAPVPAVFETAAARRLMAVRDELAAAAPRDPLSKAFFQLHEETDLDLGAARDLVLGVLSDLEPVRVADEAELLLYCYRVAGTVGLMMARVLDVRAPEALEHAKDLGIAMQMTNIARDVLEDAKMDRRYLPASWLDAAPEEIARAPEPLRAPAAAAVLRLLEEADRYYASGAAGYRFLAWRPRVAIAVAARVYRGIGSEIRRRDGAYWRGRAVVPTWRKALITAPVAANPRLYWAR